MGKRARYDGPGEVFVSLDGGDVSQFRPSNGVYVKHGELLPEQTDAGDNVPAKLRDELTASEFWTEVNQSDTKDTKDGEK